MRMLSLFVLILLVTLSVLAPPLAAQSADTTPPSLVSAVVDSFGDEITLTFDENIDYSSLPLPFDRAISFTADGEPVRFAYTVMEIGSETSTIGFGGLVPVIAPGQSVVVTYTDPTPGDDDLAIQDAVGNDAASFTVTATNNSTTRDATPPSLVSVVVEDNGEGILFTFDEFLYIPDGFHDFIDDLFSVTADGNPVRGSGGYQTSLELFGLLELSPVITRGQTVVVSYTDPTQGNDQYAIQDRFGNDAASFTENAVNNSIVGPVPALPLAGVGLLGLLLACLGGWLRRRGG